MVRHLVKHCALDDVLNFPLGADVAFLKGVAFALFRKRLHLGAIFRFKLAKQPRPLPRIHAGDKITGEINHLFKVRAGHSKKKTEPRGHTSKEPNVGDRRRKFYVSHPLAARSSSWND